MEFVMSATPLPKNVSPATAPHEDTNCTGAVEAIADFITETEAYSRFGHLLEDKELRIARQEGRLGYLRRKRKIFYRLSELQDFIDGALEKEYIRGPRALQPKPTHKSQPAPAASERLRGPATVPAATSSPVGDAGLKRLAQKIARSEGRI